MATGTAVGTGTGTGTAGGIVGTTVTGITVIGERHLKRI